MATITKFRDLEIWQDAMDICEEVYRLTEDFPRREQYGLSAQMRRAAVSVPSNIAEGFVRRHGKEVRHFLSIVLGSIAELDTQVIISKRLGYISEESADALLSKTETLGRKTTNFLKGVRL